MAKAASVEFIHVFKRYGQVTAVRDVSFKVEAGQLVTLLGPSGCGKTTTLRLVAGLELASEGTIRIGNENVTQLGAAERDVSMVFQSYALFPHMNVLDNVMYGPLVSGASRKDAEAMAIEKALVRTMPPSAAIEGIAKAIRTMARTNIFPNIGCCSLGMNCAQEVVPFRRWDGEGSHWRGVNAR